ncbi:hypothetical protein L6452_36189 [Arctium lappa]|uniref:Uncharacterized protein n=1 Tax=Arctium lappa TaxID=4217 RepID=A0ACB8Y8N7_ARCLA|nr:hypothetical protein L6452_36189 [Arctium lappa]
MISRKLTMRMHPKRDDSVLLDEDDSDDSPVIVRVNEDHQLRRVKKRVNEDNGSSPLSHEGNGSASVVELGTDTTMTSRRGRKRKDGKSDFIIRSSDENLKTDTSTPISIQEETKKGSLPPIPKVVSIEKTTGQGSSMSPPEREKNDSGKKLGRKEEGSSTGRRSRVRVIRTRTSPHTLHETISALDDDQRKAVTDMGLGSLLTMTIQGVPSKLGFFVVDRESTELDDGGFGRLPLIHRVENRVNNTNTANIKDGVDDGQPDTQEDIAKDLIHLIKKRTEKIKELKVDAESAINKGLTDYPDEGGFTDLQVDLNRLFKQSAASGARTPNSTPKLSFLSSCADMVVSQPIDDHLAVLWESPTCMREVVESMRVYVENSKERRIMNEIEPPGFDLGIIPMKDIKSGEDGQSGYCVSGLRTGKGEPLKSPYVMRVVEINVTSEDRKVHEWALSIFGGKCDPVFKTKESINIMRTELETLAATNMNISPSVVFFPMRDDSRFQPEKHVMHHYRQSSIELATRCTPCEKIRICDRSTVEEGQRQQNQLEDLMKKYVAKIILHDHNLVRSAMKNEVERFNSLESDIKARILLQASESRLELLT